MVFAGLLDEPGHGFRLVSDRELIATFHRHREACDGLRTMLVSESRCDAIGTDLVGTWWKGHPLGWRAGNHRTTDLAQVLADAGLTPERHREYLDLLGRLGAYRVTAHQDADRDCEIHLTRRGNVVRAILKSFVHSPSGEHPPALVPRPGDPDEEHYTPLGGGWFFRYLDH
jgi:hypothetical protein